MDEAIIEIECGFCCRKSDTIVSPKILPCEHVHCLECLTAYYKTKRLLLCGEEGCGKVFEIDPNTLPFYNLAAEGWCDPCLKKSTREEAVTYCTFCKKKFCKHHLKSHDDALEDHCKITIDKYKADTKKALEETCQKHGGLRYVLGCQTCHDYGCVKCVPEMGNCKPGLPHNFLLLEDLVSTSFKEEIIARSLAREDEYEQLFKETSKVQSEYDEETARMFKLIRETREDQMKELQLRYDNLEQTVLDGRRKTSIKIADFLEEGLYQKWRDLRNDRELVEAKAKLSQPVDVLKSFKALKEKLRRITVPELPDLELGTQLILNRAAANRNIELEVVMGNEATARAKQQGDLAIQSSSSGVNQEESDEDWGYSDKEYERCEEAAAVRSEAVMGTKANPVAKQGGMQEISSLNSGADQRKSDKKIGVSKNFQYPLDDPPIDAKSAAIRSEAVMGTEATAVANQGGMQAISSLASGADQKHRETTERKSKRKFFSFGELVTSAVLHKANIESAVLSASVAAPKAVGFYPSKGKPCYEENMPDTEQAVTAMPNRKTTGGRCSQATGIHSDSPDTRNGKMRRASSKKS